MVDKFVFPISRGDPIPNVLIDKVEEYIPQDPSQLISVFKVISADELIFPVYLVYKP